MCRPKTNRAARLVAAALTAVGCGGWLAGCSNSDLYLDHRDSIALGAGDAIAGNAVNQMVDPWPPSSGDRNIAFNGQKMQAAVQRYRTDKVVAPVDPSTLQSSNQSGQTISQTTVNAGTSAPPPAATTTAQ
jgi:hypothetical protein